MTKKQEDVGYKRPRCCFVSRALAPEISQDDMEFGVSVFSFREHFCSAEGSSFRERDACDFDRTWSSRSGEARALVKWLADRIHFECSSR